MSDAAHRPRNLSATDNWLAWGPYPDVFVLYRHMLPAASFAHAVQRVPTNGDPARTMGRYYPQTVFCSTVQFERNRCGLPLVRRKRTPAARNCRAQRRHARACRRNS